MKFSNKFIAFSMGLLLSSVVSATTSSGIGIIATQINSQFGSIALLITAAAYVAGLGFIMGGILKLKAYKDNPQQTAIGIPMTMLAVGGLLVYLPSLVGIVGGTFFTSGTTAGVTGVSNVG
jgi:intracellular multiplication protein IcmD